MNAPTTRDQRITSDRAVRYIKYLLFSASIVPSVLAGAMAWRLGYGSLPVFALVTFALFLGQAAGDYLYFHFTSFHTDQRDAHTKIFAGWKPLFIGSLLPPSAALSAGIGCLVVDGLIGLYFLAQLGPTVLALAAAGGAVAVFFTPLMLRGWKEPLIFLTFGPLSMLSVFFVLTEELSLEPVLVSFPIAFLVTLVGYLKSGRLEVHAGAGGMVVSVRRPVVIFLLVAAYLSLAVLLGLGLMPLAALAGFLTVPLGFVLVRRLATAKGISDYLGATVLSLLCFIGTGALLAIGYAWG